MLKVKDFSTDDRDEIHTLDKNEWVRVKADAEHKKALEEALYDFIEMVLTAVIEGMKFKIAKMFALQLVVKALVQIKATKVLKVKEMTNVEVLVVKVPTKVVKVVIEEP